MADLKRQKVYSIDTKPSDKGLFDPKIGGHRFGITLGALQQLQKSSPGRYKQEGGATAELEPAASTTVTKVPGLKTKDAKVSADFSIKEANDEIEKQTEVPALDAFINGEIRKGVLEAYQRKLKNLKGKK